MAEPSTDPLDIVANLLLWSVYAILWIGIPLGVVYGLVRFVKWAWAD